MTTHYCLQLVLKYAQLDSFLGVPGGTLVFAKARWPALRREGACLVGAPPPLLSLGGQEWSGRVMGNSLQPGWRQA